MKYNFDIRLNLIFIHFSHPRAGHQLGHPPAGAPGPRPGFCAAGGLVNGGGGPHRSGTAADAAG